MPLFSRKAPKEDPFAGTPLTPMVHMEAVAVAFVPLSTLDQLWHDVLAHTRVLDHATWGEMRALLDDPTQIVSIERWCTHPWFEGFLNSALEPTPRPAIDASIAALRHRFADAAPTSQYNQYWFRRMAPDLAARIFPIPASAGAGAGSAEESPSVADSRAAITVEALEAELLALAEDKRAYTRIRFHLRERAFRDESFSEGQFGFLTTLTLSYLAEKQWKTKKSVEFIQLFNTFRKNRINIHWKSMLAVSPDYFWKQFAASDSEHNILPRYLWYTALLMCRGDLSLILPDDEDIEARLAEYQRKNMDCALILNFARLPAWIYDAEQRQRMLGNPRLPSELFAPFRDIREFFSVLADNVREESGLLPLLQACLHDTHPLHLATLTAADTDGQTLVNRYFNTVIDQRHKSEDMVCKAFACAGVFPNFHAALENKGRLFKNRCFYDCWLRGLAAHNPSAIAVLPQEDRPVLASCPMQSGCFSCDSLFVATALHYLPEKFEKVIIYMHHQADIDTVFTDLAAPSVHYIPPTNDADFGSKDTVKHCCDARMLQLLEQGIRPSEAVSKDVFKRLREEPHVIEEIDRAILKLTSTSTKIAQDSLHSLLIKGEETGEVDLHASKTDSTTFRPGRK